MQIETITSGRIGNNTYVIVKNNNCIIIDASADIKTLNKIIKDKNVLGVFLTHGHYDHFQNLEEIVKTYNIKCFITPKEYEKLFNPKLNYSILFGLLKVCNLKKEDFVFLKDNDKIVLDNVVVSSFLTKGHTDGSICIEIEGNVWTGDTKFLDGYGRTDFVTGSENDMKNSLDFLEKKFKNFNFYPGHGKSGKI